MIRWLSIGVISYMILGILWWGYLLSQKNADVYQLKKSVTSDVQEIARLESEESRQSFMILGEGIVLGCSLLLGIYIINRSANKEIQNAKQQNNFLLSVSHELKSPIAAIKLALQTIVRPGISKEKEASFQHSALEDTKRLEKLVQNILLSASIESDAIELYKTEIDIITQLQGLVSNLNSEIKKDRLKMSTELNTCLIMADQQNIRQALLNLLDNALKYSPHDSLITIQIKKNIKAVQIIISNSGPPIAPQERLKIFDKFYRGNNQEVRTKEGTGIGLYITKEIISAHKGEINITSHGEINSFIVTLPINE